MRIMITGGGTGGHTSPAVAILEELQRRDPQLHVQWVGRRGGLEERIATGLAVPFRSVPVEGWPRKRAWRRLWVGAKLAVAIVRSGIYLWKFRPQIVVGVGGYVSLPLVWTAQQRKIPTILHEQNKRLGMANRVLAPRAARVLLSYRDTIGEYPVEKARVVGNPVRAGFAHPLPTHEARKQLGLEETIAVVLVSGGSQGAHTLNRAVQECLPQLQPEEVQIIWVTGQADFAEARRTTESAAVRTRAYAFTDQMAVACAAADLLVCRAGASTTAEIAMLGKPSVLIPYPYATDNHQEQNARAFEQAGAALVLSDQECSGTRLLEIVRELLGATDRLRRMGEAANTLAYPNAAEAIVDEILDVVFEESSR
ncbi:MAG: undecaprenyldiphospho-muramoylpentapeptide beta-N-acetylglucosaminyltransferase [Candidatus Hydrogenedentes bacterium]|nr:undecaprenyldiphospho-muramoylpentapeptide beta-N-acetylglucosaminyltransferase [Candidatus Hydrogenedentota bacterium]